MGGLHRTTLSIIRKLRGVRPVDADMVESFRARDDSMAPTLLRCEAVQFDTGALVEKGVIVAIATEDFVEFRELQIHDGEFYLVVHNAGFPTVSMRDYRELNPGAYFCGVVC